MILRIPRFLAIISFLALPCFSQTVPRAQEVAAHWLAAIHVGQSPSSRTAVLTCASTEDGIQGNVVETLKASGEYRRSIKREFDEAELVLAEKINQRRDWNGFVREMRGKELERLRTMAGERLALVF